MANDYLKTLYKDLTKKQKAIAHYQDRSRESLQQLHQVTYEWIGQLQKKYEVIDKFRKSRDRVVPSNFAVEKSPEAQQPQENQAVDIKKMETTIKNINSQINYLFQQASKDLEIQTQSYTELQSLVNQIFEQFEEIYSGMGS